MLWPGHTARRNPNSAWAVLPSDDTAAGLNLRIGVEGVEAPPGPLLPSKAGVRGRSYATPSSYTAP